ncbi:hypothetical protein BH09VER1_BH09VER1_32260 [soil metagenome]
MTSSNLFMQPCVRGLIGLLIFGASLLSSLGDAIYPTSSNNNNYVSGGFLGSPLEIVMLDSAWNNNVTLSGMISGDSSVTVDGSAPVTLSGSNTFQGSLNLYGGAVRFSNESNLGTSPFLQISGGTLLSLNDVTVNRTIAIGTGSSSFYTGSGYVTRTGGTFGGTGRMTLAGAIYGGGSLNKIDAGTLTLSGTNTYTGGTNISGGILEVAGDNALGSGTITLTGGGIRAAIAPRNITNALVFNGAFTLGRSTTLSGNATLAGNSTIISANPDVSGAASSTLSGVISGGSSLSFDTGANPIGNIIISGSNTYTGGSNILSGTVTMANANALGTTGQVSISSGATLNASTYGLNLARLSGVGPAATTGTVTSSGTYSYNSSSTANVANVLAGSASLTKAGNGDLILSGASTYSGGTLISAGLVKINSDTALGTGTITMTGGGLWAWDTAHTLTNAFVFNGTFSIGNFTTIKGGVSLAGDSTIISRVGDAGSGNLNIDGAISGNYSLTFQKENDKSTNFILAGTNTYSGGTTVRSGNVVMANASAMGTGIVTVNGGTFDASTYGFDLSRLAGSSSVISIGAYTASSNSNLNLSNMFGGSASLIKTGTGSLTLNGVSSYTGGTVINSGTVFAATASALGTGTITLNGGGLGATGANAPFTSLDNDLVFNGTFSLGRNTTLDGNVALTSNSTIISTNPADGFGKLTFWGVISGNYSLSFIDGINPNNDIVLSATNTYTGGTNISAGLVTLQNARGLGTTGQVTIASGAKLDARSYDFDISRLAGSGTIETSGDYLTYSSANQTLAVSLTGSATLNKDGTGALTLTGTNTYTGETDVFDGSLVIGSDQAINPNSVIVMQGGGLAAAGGPRTLTNTLLLAGNFSLGRDLTLTGTATLFGNSSIISTNATPGGGTATLASNISGNRQLVFYGGVNPNDTIVVSGSNSYTGRTIISDIKVTMGSVYAFGSGTVTVNSILDAAGYAIDFTRVIGTGTITTTGTYNVSTDSFLGVNNVLAGSAALVKSGTGETFLYGANTYTGGTTITSGTLTMYNAAALSSTGTVTIASGALLYDGFNYGFDVTRLAGSGTILSGGSYRTSVADATVATILAGSASLTKTGAGTLTLTGSNSYTGGTTLNAGTLELGGASVLGSGRLTINGGSLRANGAPRTLLNSVTLAGSFTLGRATTLAGDVTLASDITITSANPDTSTSFFTSNISGNISGARSLTFTEGANPIGTIILSGSNTYSGGTTIQAGTVQASHDRAMGTGTITVNGGIFLVDTGVTVANAISLQGGQYQRALVPGASLANAVNATSSFAGGNPDTIAKILQGTLGSGATLTSRFANASSALNDQIRLSDVYSFHGTGSSIFVLQLSMTSVAAGSYLGWLDPNTNQWVNAVFGNTGTNNILFVNGAYDNNLVLGHYGVDTATGSVWAVLNHNSDFAAVPEPSTVALCLAGLLILAMLQHRRQVSR